MRTPNISPAKVNARRFSVLPEGRHKFYVCG
jgi:hypothetical protein